MNRPNGDPRRPQNSRASNPNKPKTHAPNGQRPQSAQNISPKVTAQQRSRSDVRRQTVGADPLKSSNKKKQQPRKTVKPTNGKTPAKSRQTAPTTRTNTPRPPINKKANAAAAGAMNTKQAAPARRKFRGGNYILYYLLFAVVVVIVLIILANTVLFNCKEIEVLGASRYLPDEIIDASAIRAGDNLLHIDKNEAAEKIVRDLAYVDAAQVEKSFPTKVVITVTEAEKWFCVSQLGVNALISRGGKIVEQGFAGDLPVVTGYEAKSLETGSRLVSNVEGKQSIPEQILNAADKAGVTNIDSIDMTDRFSIKMVVDGRITLELGGVTKIESKMAAAYKIIEEKISSSESVTVLLTNPEKIAVRPNTPNEPDQTSQPDQTSDLPENSTSGE